MAEFSYPFDAGSGAIVTEDDWSDMAKNWQDDGVVSDALTVTALEVETLAEPNEIFVNPGMAVIQGFMYRNTTALPLTFSSNASGNPRMDRVVLRLDRTTNVIEAAIKEGTPAASPVAPDVDTVYPIHEISLGYYTVTAGSSLALTVLPERPFTSRRIIVSDDLGTAPKGSIVYSPTEDKFYGVKFGSTFELGTGGGGGGGSMLFIKGTDQAFSTTTRQNDTALTWLPPDGYDAQILVEGVIYYWCGTPSAAFTFSLGGTVSSPPTTKARFLYQTSASANPALSSLSNASLGSLTVSVGAVASSTFYTVEFQFVGRFAGFDDPEFDTIMPRYQPANGAHAWTISANSWMRITEIT